MAIAALIADRDGTLNRVSKGQVYILDPVDVRLLPGAAAVAGRLTRAGVPLHVVTMQNCIARGIATPEQVRAVNMQIQGEIEQHGGKIETFTVIPDAKGDQRKVLAKAAAFALIMAEHDYAPETTWAIGDSATDTAAAIMAGCNAMVITQDASRHGSWGRLAVVVVESFAYGVNFLITNVL